jgi:hypothetical protein
MDHRCLDVQIGACAFDRIENTAELLIDRNPGIQKGLRPKNISAHVTHLRARDSGRHRSGRESRGAVAGRLRRGTTVSEA